MAVLREQLFLLSFQSQFCSSPSWPAGLKQACGGGGGEGSFEAFSSLASLWLAFLGGLGTLSVP